MDLKKIMIVALLILLAVISVTKIAPWARDPENHTHTIEQTEDKIATVMTLSGGAAATAATLSLLPGDMCTPIAEQMAELAKYFLVILSSLYLEKFLIVISGFLTFAVFIPAALLVECGSVLFNKKNWTGIAMKIGFLGLVLFLIVPEHCKQPLPDNNLLGLVFHWYPQIVHLQVIELLAVIYFDKGIILGLIVFKRSTNTSFASMFLYCSEIA